MSHHVCRFVRCIVLFVVLAVTPTQYVEAQATKAIWQDSALVVANLASFARLYGVLRWYHPSDEAYEADWDSIAVQGLLHVRDAADASELADRLEGFFQAIAPSVRVFPSADSDPMPANLMPPESTVRLKTITWEHAGLGTEYSDSLGGIYSSFRSSTPCTQTPTSREPLTPLLLPLGGGVSAWVATTLYADSEGTFPRPQVSQAESIETDEADDVAFLLADAIVIWNAMQHFYPYFDVVEGDWGHILDQTLQRILATSSDYTHDDMKADMLVPLKDGHANIRTSGSKGTVAIPDLSVSLVGNQLVITACEGEALALGIQPGDIISRIDGKPAMAVLHDVMEPWSGSPQRRLAIGLLFLLVDLKGTSIDIQIQSANEETRQVSLTRTRTAPLSTRQFRSVEEIEPGILYIDVSRASVGSLSLAKRRIPSAKGVIIDARGYPIDRFWSKILTDRPLLSMELLVPLSSTPNQADTTMRSLTTSSTAVGSMPEHIVFLIDASAFSAGEHQLSYFRGAGIGTFVGTPTAGVNGNINRLGLPSGAVLTWTGMIAEWPGGMLFHTIGIEPDVLVEPTRAGIAAGQDEQFDEALQVLKEMLSATESS